MPPHRRGWARRYTLLSGGKWQIFSFHIAGDVPDRQSQHVPILDHSIAAVTKAVVGCIPHAKMLTLAVDFSNLGALLRRDTLIDAGILRAWMVGMGRRSAYERVAHLFCELYLKLQALGLAADLRCPLPITQTDLADALGLTPVHINCVLRDKRARTWLTLRSSTRVIDTGDELLRLSEFDPTYLRLEKRATG